METTFYIQLNMKTIAGYEAFGKFTLGKDRQLATNVFNQLKGTRQVDESAVLYVDLIEEKDGLPINLEIMSCKLAEIAENTKIITKELFKSINLKEI